MNSRRLLSRLACGHVGNVRFDDLLGLAQALGFELRRVTGSHHLLKHPELDEILNLQDIRGQAKPYQVRQLLRLVERYDLRLEG